MSESNGREVEIEFKTVVPIALIRCVVPTPDGAVIHLMNGQHAGVKDATHIAIGVPKASEILTPSRKIIV